MSAPEQAGDTQEGLRAEFALHRGSFTLRATLAAPPGLTALLGPSGAGKSLTLQALAGLIGIERGAIHLNGRALTDTQRRMALAPRLRRVGYVPQSYALFPHLTVGANIAYGLPGRADRSARDKRVAELLRLVHLPGFESRATRDLSGGEAQRVALARALAAQPEALLLDEPFSALDAPTRGAIRDDLREIALATGLPTLLVTHDLSEALALASRLILLVDGRVITQGTVEQVTARPTTALAARLLGWGATLPLAQAERLAERVCVTLPGGQRLALALADCAPAALVSLEGAQLALRPERLAVARATDGVNAAAPEQTLRGEIRSLEASGPLWRARVAFAGAPAMAKPLDLPFSAREWQAVGLAVGDAVTLTLTDGAARLVASDDWPDGTPEEAQR